MTDSIRTVRAACPHDCPDTFAIRVLAIAAFSRDVSFDALREQGCLRLPLPDAPLAEGGFPTPSGKCVIGRSPSFYDGLVDVRLAVSAAS